MSRALRPHQARIIERLRVSLASGHRRPMVQAPTGAGKTVVAGAIVKGALAKGKRVLFVVPALSLIDQTVRSFWAEGIREIGVIQGNHPMTNPAYPVQVASIQTLQRRAISPFDIVVIDEAHRWFAMLGQWMAAPDWASIPFVGLSATPWTKGLGKHYDDLIQVTTTAELIAAGYLAPFRVYAPSHPDLSGVRTVAGDYHEGDLGEAMNKPELVADVVTTWRQRGENRPTFVFAVDRPHAKRLQSEFEAAGVTCGYIDAFTRSEDREALFRRFTAGEVRVITSVGCLTTGVDLDVRCIVLARPTKSEMLFVQIIGRGLRTAPGKTDCLARGTLVLTDRGEVPIEDVTLADRVWDGVSFVRHAGAVCKGVHPVITHDGITATPDHEVMTDDGWLPLSEAHRFGVRIARTGMGGRPLRFSKNRVHEYRGVGVRSQGGGTLRQLLIDAYGSLSQHAPATQHEGVSALQPAGAGGCALVALPTMPSTAGSLQQSAQSWLPSLWRAGHQVWLRWAERGGALDRGQSWRRRSVLRDRPNKQRWALRGWQSSLGAPCREHEQYAGCDRGSPALHGLQEEASEHTVRRYDTLQAGAERADRSANHRPMEHSVEQAEGEVWDILNAGPLQRFTANGRLVHNCLILDHSDTHLRLGFVTDIRHDALDDGRERSKQERDVRAPALPKECPSCKFVKPAKVPKCPSCGFKPEKQSEIQCEDGDLVEMTPKRARAGVAEKESLFGQLKHYARRRDYSEGWAAHKFRELTGVWPDRYHNAPLVEPTPFLLGWIKSRQIAWIKTKGARA